MSPSGQSDQSEGSYYDTVCKVEVKSMKEHIIL